jgi:Uma2 family endonuclease
LHCGDNPTVRLDEHNEPQPDACLFIDPKGQARIGEEGYIEGPPELMAEVASSSVSHDLHAKKKVFERFGVKEYIVWRVLDGEVDWFVARAGEFVTLPSLEGVVRSEVFPGLWLDVPALVGGDLRRVLSVLQQGLASAEHAAFVRKLAEGN